MKLRKGYKLTENTNPNSYIIFAPQEFEELKKTPWGKNGFKGFTISRTFILR